MNPFIMLLLVFFLLGSGSVAMAIVFLQSGEPQVADSTADTAKKDQRYCWWC